MFKSRFLGYAGATALLAVILGVFIGSTAQGHASSTTGPPGASGPSVDEKAAPTLVYECLSLVEGQDPNQAVMLDTNNFGKDMVTVRTSRMMCESALKYRQPPAGTQLLPPTLKSVLQCFRLQNGQDPDDLAVLVTQNFGPNTVRIRTSRTMCESAAKAFGGAVTPNPVTFVWQCFDIDFGANPNIPVVLVTNNFGPHKAVVGRAVMMCEMAKKITSAGNVYNADHKGEVYQCFRLESPTLNLAATLDTRNFGKDDVRIRRPNLMCEPARKTIIFDNPNDTPAASAADDD